MHGMTWPPQVEARKAVAVSKVHISIIHAFTMIGHNAKLRRASLESGQEKKVRNALSQNRTAKIAV